MFVRILLFIVVIEEEHFERIFGALKFGFYRQFKSTQYFILNYN